MAEWLGSALQKLLQRFESASDLQPSRNPKQPLGVFLCAMRTLKPKEPRSLGLDLFGEASSEHIENCSASYLRFLSIKQYLQS